MNNFEIELLMNTLRRIEQEQAALGEFIREHMKEEEFKIERIDKRLSKLEWRANAVSAAAGSIAGILGAIIMKILG